MAFAKGRDGSPSGPKIQGAQRRFRQKRGGCAAKMGRLGDTPLPLGFDERVFAWRLSRGREGSPSGPKIQARSAVSGKKSSSILSIFEITFRWNLAANRYHTIFPLGSISMVRCFSSRAAPRIVR